MLVRQLRSAHISLNVITLRICYNCRKICRWSRECPQCGIFSHSSHPDQSRGVVAHSVSGSLLSPSVGDSDTQSKHGPTLIHSPTGTSGM